MARGKAHQRRRRSRLPLLGDCAVDDSMRRFHALPAPLPSPCCPAPGHAARPCASVPLLQAARWTVLQCSASRRPAASVNDSAAWHASAPAPCPLLCSLLGYPKESSNRLMRALRLVGLWCGRGTPARRYERGMAGLQPAAHQRSTASRVGTLLRRAGKGSFSLSSSLHAHLSHVGDCVGVTGMVASTPPTRLEGRKELVGFAIDQMRRYREDHHRPQTHDLHVAGYLYRLLLLLCLCYIPSSSENKENRCSSFKGRPSARGSHTSEVWGRE